MRLVIGVDWSEHAFDAVQVATALFRPDDVALVHAVDLGWFRNPVVAEAGNVQGYDDYKLAMMDCRSMQYLGGVFTGMTEEEFVAAMRAGGRRVG